jgi:hypothetical protein
MKQIQKIQERNVRETPAVERQDEQPIRRTRLQIEPLEGRLAPTPLPASGGGGWG